MDVVIVIIVIVSIAAAPAAATNMLIQIPWALCLGILYQVKKHLIWIYGPFLWDLVSAAKPFVQFS
jgi:hypothetical protein